MKKSTQKLFSALFFLGCFLIVSGIWAQNSIAYCFEGNYDAAGNGPSLLTNEFRGNFNTNNSDCANPIQYVDFLENSQLFFDNSRADNFLGSAYTIEMLFSLEDVSDWSKILDFNNLETDDGLYVSDDAPGVLWFYDLDLGGTTTLVPNQVYHVIFRREADNTITAWLNGNQEFTGDDSGELAVLDESNRLYFFNDDENDDETSNGEVYMIRIYNEDLSDTQINNLSSLSFCELAEGESHTSVTAQPITYLFNGDLEDEEGITPLNSLVFQTDSELCGSSFQYFNFPTNPGLRFDNTQAGDFLDKDAYTIQMIFSLENLESWRRLLDFSNRDSDFGFYVNSSDTKLRLYNYDEVGTTVLEPNTIYNLVFRRSSDNTVSVWMDGNLEFSVSDESEYAVLNDDNFLSFFTDDGEGEASPGNAYYIRLFDEDLSDEAVADLYLDEFCDLVFCQETERFAEELPPMSRNGLMLLFISLLSLGVFVLYRQG